MLVALIFVGIIVFGKIINPSENSDEIPVPNLIGKSYTEEIQINKEWNENFRIVLGGEAYSETIRRDVSWIRIPSPTPCGWWAPRSSSP